MSRRKPVGIEACRTGIPMPDYLSMDAAGASDIEAMSRSPLDCFTGMHREEAPPKGDARAFGTAMHYALLEPDLFKERVAFLPQHHDGRTKDGKALKKQMLGAYEIVLGHQRHLDILQIRHNVKANPAFTNILTLAGQAEVTVTVKDPMTGVMCKCRPDRLLPDQKILFDLKTTRAVTPFQFGRQAFDYGYDRKMAYYLHLLRWLREAGKMHGDYEHAVIGAVQNAAPFNVGIFVIPEEMLEAAWGSVRKHLTRFAECVATGEWPGWDSEPVTLDPEKWMLDRRLADAEE